MAIPNLAKGEAVGESLGTPWRQDPEILRGPRTLVHGNGSCIAE